MYLDLICWRDSWESESERKTELYPGTEGNLVFLLSAALRIGLLFGCRLVQPPITVSFSSVCVGIDSLAPDRFRYARKHALFAALVFLILLAILVTPSPCLIAPREKNLSLLAWQTGSLKGSIGSQVSYPSSGPALQTLPSSCSVCYLIFLHPVVRVTWGFCFDHPYLCGPVTLITL